MGLRGKYLVYRIPSFQRTCPNERTLGFHSIVPKLPPESQISLRLALWVAISKISAILHFPIGHNVKLQSFFKKLKFEISKFQDASFVWTVRGNIQKKVGRKRIKIVGGVAF